MLRVFDYNILYSQSKHLLALYSEASLKFRIVSHLVCYHADHYQSWSSLLPFHIVQAQSSIRFYHEPTVANWSF